MNGLFYIQNFNIYSLLINKLNWGIRMKYILIMIIIAFNLLVVPQLAFCQVLEGMYYLMFSLSDDKDLNTASGIQRFYPSDLIKWEGGSLYSRYWKGSDYLGNYKNMDAVETLNDGSIIFSLSTDWTQDGTTYEEEDLIKWTPGIGFSMFWDSSTSGVPTENNLDAVHIENDGSIIFSLASNWSAYGFKDQDLIKWTPGSGFSLFWSPSGYTGDQDAADILLNNDILFSTTSIWTYNSITYQTNDIIKYSIATSTYSLAWDASAHGLGTGSGWNINALTTSPIPEPSSLILLLCGLMSFAIFIRKNPFIKL